MQHRPDARPHGSPSSQSPHRVVRDDVSGREWHIHMADCRDIPGSRGASCLICDCGTLVRRVWAPSPEWHLLPDRELLALVERDP